MASRHRRRHQLDFDRKLAPKALSNRLLPVALNPHSSPGTCTRQGGAGA